MSDLPRTILDGIKGRCPRCHRGSLFDGYIKVADHCADCGLGLGGHDTGDGPAFFIILPLSILTAVLALLVEVAYQPPMWVHVITWPLFIAFAVGFLLRPVKGIMIVLQYRYRNVEHDTDNEFRA